MPPRTPPPSARTEARDVVELRRLLTSHPELETAIALQIALLDLQRRVQVRVPVPAVPSQEQAAQTLGAGRPLLRFRDVPLSWTEFRYVLRETADLLRRFDLMDPAAHAALEAIARDGHHLEPLVERWFTRVQQAAGLGAGAPETAEPARPEHEQAVALAMRPFLIRCAEAMLSRLDLAGWQRGCCPLCAAEPDFAVLSARGDYALICSRCTGHWPFDVHTCPFCANDDRLRLTTFTSRDGRYRITACDVCLRYVKAYDERAAPRPLLLAVDTIATLPLDAAAIQRGYLG